MSIHLPVCKYSSLLGCKLCNGLLISILSSSKTGLELFSIAIAICHREVWYVTAAISHGIYRLDGDVPQIIQRSDA